jgi:hypothetical protein
MKTQEDNTTINDVGTFLNQKVNPITGSNQATNTILEDVESTRKPLKDLTLPEYCMYPNSSRKDDYNFTKGLGQVSLQPVIDQLNSFKNAAIQAIVAQYNAMGPEASKDKNLQNGAMAFLATVYEAAKCYTSVVNKINALVSTYIQVVDKMIVDIIAMINKIEGQITTLVTNIRKLKTDLLTVITVQTYELLEKATGIAEYIQALSQIEIEFNEAKQATYTLSKTPERVMLNLEVNLTQLRNQINSLNYFTSLKSSLSNSSTTAANAYMTDDYLSSINLLSVDVASYNWSITNSLALSDYSTIDTLNIIPALNKICAQYTEPTSTSNLDTISQPLLIASSEQAGTIVVPDLETGLISAGLDPAIGTNCSLIFELSINNGETLIRAIARGDVVDATEEYIHHNDGVYYSKGIEKFSYNKIIVNSTNSWDLYLTDTTTMPSVGSYYYFNDPMTTQPWNFYWQKDGVNYYFPVLFKVTNVTHNYITVTMMDGSNLDITDFISGAVSSDYSTYNPYTLPGNIADASGDYIIYVKFQSQEGTYDYAVADSNNNPILGSNGYYKTVSDLGTSNPANDADAATWFYTTGGVTYYILKDILYSVTMNQYIMSAGSGDNSPHSGDQIPCNNWALTVYPIGDQTSIRKLNFSAVGPGTRIYMFYLRAHWGFVPTTTLTSSSTTSTTYSS